MTRSDPFLSISLTYSHINLNPFIHTATCSNVLTVCENVTLNKRKMIRRDTNIIFYGILVLLDGPEFI